MFVNRVAYTRFTAGVLDKARRSSARVRGVARDVAEVAGEKDK